MIRSTVCFHYHSYANTIYSGVTWFMMIISLHNIWFYVLFFLGVLHASSPSCNAHLSMCLLGGYQLLVFGGFLGIFWLSQYGLVSILLTLALTQPNISHHLWTWEFPLPFSFVDLLFPTSIWMEQLLQYPTEKGCIKENFFEVAYVLNYLSFILTFSW